MHAFFPLLTFWQFNVGALPASQRQRAACSANQTYQTRNNLCSVADSCSSTLSHRGCQYITQLQLLISSILPCEPPQPTCVPSFSSVCPSFPPLQQLASYRLRLQQQLASQQAKYGRWIKKARTSKLTLTELFLSVSLAFPPRSCSSGARQARLLLS